MTTLHIVNKLPPLASCLRTARDGDTVLLIEDGVYGATRGGPAEAALQALGLGLRVCVLLPDLEARGMAARRVDTVEAINYGDFVDLVTHHTTCQSWL
ncbi:MAG: sulfurtransferase complex subunit TusB [Burkholderiales bacterium]|nr:sulfurtransferase complex subunit TusB [Burkholderiales bacterium]